MNDQRDVRKQERSIVGQGFEGSSTLTREWTAQSEEEDALAERARKSHGKRWLINSMDFSRLVFRGQCWQSGISIHVYGYSREGLEILDKCWLGPDIESMAESLAKSGFQPSTSKLWGEYHMVGTYLGDIIVKNLGGDWHIPGTLRLALSRLLGWPELLFFHWNVKLNGKRIPVFKIAKWRFDGSERVPSLAEAYDRIKSTGTWP